MKIPICEIELWARPLVSSNNRLNIDRCEERASLFYKRFRQNLNLEKSFYNFAEF